MRHSGGTEKEPRPAGDAKLASGRLTAVGASLKAAHALAQEVPSRKHADRLVRDDSAFGSKSINATLSLELVRASEELHAAEAELAAQQQSLIEITRQLEVERQQYRDLFEFAPDAYFVTTPEGEIIEANRAAHAMLAVHPGSLVGNLLGVYLVGRNERAIVPSAWATLPPLTRQERMARIRRRDGGVADVAVAAVRIPDPESAEAVGVRWIVRDVSAQVQAETEVRRLNAELEGRVAKRTEELEIRTRELAEKTVAAEVANRAKAAFLATISHEIRTPLNAVAGYAELLEMGVQGPLNAAQLDFIERIRRANGYLLSLVNDILNFSKLDASRVHFAKEPVPTDVVLASAEALIEPQAQRKGVQFTRVVSDPAPVAFGDQEKVLQIVLNLLTNAVKFTERGGRITLSAGVAGGAVWIEVRDTGRGIPGEHLGLIFEPFVQIGRQAAGLGQGVGLGLAISRDLAYGMGGDLVAESQVGVGSTFRLTLPVVEAPVLGGPNTADRVDTPEVARLF